MRVEGFIIRKRHDRKTRQLFDNQTQLILNNENPFNYMDCLCTLDIKGDKEEILTIPSMITILVK